MLRRFVIIEKPKTTWSEVGGLTAQIDEIKEVVELPLKKPELFRKLGISPQKESYYLVLQEQVNITSKSSSIIVPDTTFIEIVGFRNRPEIHR